MSAVHITEAGHHYNTSWFSSWPHLFQREFGKSVEFNPDCAYELPAYTSRDINKLYGAAWGFRGAHWNSCRFGWYWEAQTQEMLLVAYCYDRGQRNQDSQLNFPVVAKVSLNQRYECQIRVTDTAYIFQVKRGDETLGQIVSIPHGGVPAWDWTLSLYWGGDTKCPHTMDVRVE